MKKMTPIDETIDEMVIIVAKESNLSSSFLMRLDIVRFLRMVESVKKMIKLRNSQVEEPEEKEGGRIRHLNRK